MTIAFGYAFGMMSSSGGATTTNSSLKGAVQPIGQ